MKPEIILLAATVIWVVIELLRFFKNHEPAIPDMPATTGNTKLCPDCGDVMSFENGTYSCFPCDIHIDGGCRRLNETLSGLDMEKLAKHMRHNSMKEVTMTAELANQFKKK